jgi:hypothetical protein
MMPASAWAVCGDSATTSPGGYTDIAPGFDFPADEARLEAMRAAGNLAAQRRHVWQLFAGLVQQGLASGPPVFLSWYGSGDVFAGEPGPSVPMATRGLDASFAVPPQRMHQADTAPPRIIRTHYNAAAYRCIRANGLHEARVLDGLARYAAVNGTATAPRSIPTIPREAAIVKTVWWPVPADGVAPLPVWDAEQNGPRLTGNDYPTWRRVVAISRRPLPGGDIERTDVDFMGRAFRDVRLFGSNAFFHVAVDRRMAAQLMADPAARKTALMVLGRPLRAHDALVLVALSVATREIADWVWGTFWWHDAADQGRYAAQRPVAVTGPWRNYLMNVSFDANLPREQDGTPHVAYNPWLEARLTNSGGGGGLVSNCTACHHRAAWPAVQPFTVTRGGAALPDVVDGATKPLTTSSLWSIPLQAR